MPAQELGTKNERVKVITIEPASRSLLTRAHNLDTATGDSVDGNLPTDSVTAINNLESVHFNLENQNSDGNVNFNTRIPGSSNAISAIDGNLTSSQVQEIQVVSSGGSAPQVIIVDSHERNSLLGKRPAEGTVQNSLVNKIIITKNTNASQAIPVQVQTVNASHNVTVQPGISTLSQNSSTPTKTITISQQGIVSPAKGITMAQVAGTPPKLPINKLPISPAKTPTKITMIPVSGRSPQRIAPAGVGSSVLTNSTSSQATITMSPSKVIKQPGTVHVIQKPIQPTLSGATVMTIPRQTVTQGTRVTLPSNVQQIHVPGNKFHYIRLANPSSSTPAVRTQILPATAAAQAQQPVKITIPAQSAAQIVTSRPAAGSSTVQRIILPAAPNQVSIRPAPATTAAATAQIIRTTLATGTASLQQIAAGGGTTFLPAGGSGPQGMQGFALVPASYLSQIQQQIQVKPVATTAAVTVTTTTTHSQARSDYVPIASNNPVLSASTQHKNVNGSSLEGSARPRKPCNCTKSQCLKLYCDCFANGEFCHNCNCNNCANNLEHEEDRSRAIKSCLERNPLAFHPKIGKGKAGEKDRRHNKGCNCKRSGCLKNYCECYEAKIMCSSSCKCVGCKNFEESPERKTLMHLADAAEVRVQQQTAAKTKLSSQISDLPSRPVSSVTGERLPFSFVTSDVVEATCACLLAQAEEAERQLMPPVVQERMVIEEFGRCLMQIIESANRTKAPDPDDTG